MEYLVPSIAEVSFTASALVEVSNYFTEPVQICSPQRWTTFLQINCHFFVQSLQQIVFSQPKMDPYIIFSPRASTFISQFSALNIFNPTHHGESKTVTYFFRTNTPNSHDADQDTRTQCQEQGRQIRGIAACACALQLQFCKVYCPKRRNGFQVRRVESFPLCLTANRRTFAY
jgi:hypothetical protein